MTTHWPKPGTPLSSCEARIVAGLARGDSNAEIAHALGLTSSSVKNHLLRISRRLQTSGRAGVVYRAYLTRVLAGLTPEPRPRVRLSRGQQQVLEAIAAGLTNPEIARELWVTVHTVRTQVHCLFEKLGARSRAHAVALAWQQDLLPAAEHRKDVAA